MLNLNDLESMEQKGKVTQVQASNQRHILFEEGLRKRVYPLPKRTQGRNVDRYMKKGKTMKQSSYRLIQHGELNLPYGYIQTNQSAIKCELPLLETVPDNLLEDWVPAIGPKLEELSPAIEGLLNRIEDLSVYHSPEVLENGDIIVRRKKPHVPKSELEPKALPNLPKNKGLIEL